MLITGLLSVVLLLVGGLFSALDVISIPTSVGNVLGDIALMFVQGFNIVRAYTHWNYIRILFFLVIDLEVIFFTYKVIMWILRKIPFLNIK